MAAPAVSAQRKKKPKELAFIDDNCTGCGGSPVCQTLCPVDECMILQPAADNPAGIIWVDPLKCIGCRKCISKGPMDTYLEGCPWDAIQMVPLAQWEKERGALPF